MTKRKDLSKALDQVENSKGTHHAIDFKPVDKTINGISIHGAIMTPLIKLHELYDELRRASAGILVCKDDGEYMDSSERLGQALAALDEFDRTEFPQGRVVYGSWKREAEMEYGETAKATIATIDQLRDEAGNIVDSHEKHKEWQNANNRARDLNNADDYNPHMLDQNCE